MPLSKVRGLYAKYKSGELEQAMSEAIDVTQFVVFGEIDGEALPLTKCVCGKKFKYWDQVLSIYPDDPWECPGCKRKLYFRSSVKVFRVMP